MNRKRTPWLAIGLLLVSAVASAALGFATVLSLPSGAGGDLAMSAGASTGSVLAVLAGTTLLVIAQLVRASSRRAARRVARATTAG